MNVLIIEDDQRVAAIFAEVFRVEGHRVVVCNTGEDGQRYLATERPDVVFLDLKLPRMSGLDVLRDIRSRDVELPVIVVTGNIGGGEIEETIRLGITDLIEKPLILTQITEALARIAPR